MKAAVAEACVAEGAQVVNDVSGLRDPGMLEVLAAADVSACLMHMHGSPATMQREPVYGDVVAEVRAFLEGAAGKAEAAGVERRRIWIDPGIGFGKTDEHNLALLRNLDSFVATGYPVLIGVSRKGFLGRLLGGDSPLPVKERLPAALAIQTLAQQAGVRIIRTHDVAETKRAITATHAVQGGTGFRT
jgi:dihydropteroate synthase